MGRIMDWLMGPAPDQDVERDAQTYDAHEWIELHPELDDLAWQTHPRNALSIPAFYRALRMKSDLISTLPIVAEVDDLPIEGDPPPILVQPDPTEDRQTTFSRMVASLILRGEIVAPLTFDEVGFPRSLKVISPTAATRNPDGTWTINGKQWARDEVLHHIPFALPGETRGVGALELHRRVIHGEIRQSEYQRRFYVDAAMPSVVIKAARPDAGLDEMREYEQWWESQLRGRRKAVVVGGQDEVDTLGLNHEDMQYIETRQFSLGEIADIVGIPRYYLGAHTGSMAYSNVHDERRALLDIYLRGELYAIERALTSLLPDIVKAKFDPASFLRLDPKETVATVAAQTWLTDDEKRQIMGYQPLTPEQRAQMTPPPPTPAPTQPEETTAS